MTPEGLGTAIVSTFGDYDLIILTLNSEMVRIARFRNLFSLFYDHRPVYVLSSLSI